MKFCFISPIGYKTPMLFDTLVPEFEKQGHTITPYIHDCEVVLVDLHSRIGDFDIDVTNYILSRRLPIVFFDFWDYGAMSKEVWIGDNNWEYLRNLEFKKQWARFVLWSLDLCKVMFFVRKMDETKKYNGNVHPIELCLYPDCDFPEVTKEELISRKNDVCFIGNTSPTRENTIRSLIQNGFVVDAELGKQKIPHDRWLARHRNAKFFLESCGGGYGSERPYQLITISPMLKTRNTQLINADFISKFDCLKIHENMNDTDIKNLKEYLRDGDMLHTIYKQGIMSMKRYFNFGYRANYILETLKSEKFIC